MSPYNQVKKTKRDREPRKKSLWHGLRIPLRPPVLYIYGIQGKRGLPSEWAEKRDSPRSRRGIRAQCFSVSLALKEKEIKMAVMHPAAIWLIIAVIVGIVLLIATIMANRNQKKKKKGKCVHRFLHYFNSEVCINRLFTMLRQLKFMRRMICYCWLLIMHVF